MTQQRNETALTSLPNSLQKQFDRVDNLLAQSEHAQSHGNYELADSRAREAARVLQTIAQAAPELGALLAAGVMGYCGYDIEVVEQVDRYEVVERKFLGMCFGSEVVNTPTITRRTIRARLR